jgi:hypothetical protein
LQHGDRLIELLRLGIGGGQSVEETGILTMGCGNGLFSKNHGVCTVPNLRRHAGGLYPRQIIHRLERDGVLRTERLAIECQRLLDNLRTSS